MRYRIAFLTIIMLVAFTACNLGGEPPTQRPSQNTAIPQGGEPQVTIVSVAPGQNVAVNQAVTVTAAVTDTVGVTRVNLVANGQVADNFSSASSTGETNRTVQLDFTPRTVGVVTLEVVASRLDGTQSDPATVQITVGASSTNTPLPGAGATTGGTGGGTVNPCANVTASQCSACISGAAGANLRTIPDSSSQSSVIRVLPSGTIIPIVGRTSNSQWWQVRDGNSNAWLSDTVIDTLGVCTGVPVVANAGIPTATVIAIPTSTPVIPTATALNLPSPTPALPDLVVASVTGSSSLTLSGGSVTSTYTVVISNTGLGTSGAFSNTLTVLPGNTVINLGSVSSLARSESITLPATLTFTSAGTYTLSVRADSGSVVTETFEQNNTDNSFLVTVSN
jgi:hypothetical protein